MKFASALILVCAFACASAQLGVKGGSSGNQAARLNTFFPRLTPGSIQEKKEQLQLDGDDEVDGGSSGFVQPVGQTFVQPAGQTVVRPVGQTFVQPARTTVVQPVGQTFVQPAGQTFVQPAGQTVVQPVGQTFVQPAGQTFVQPAGQTFVQPAGQTVVRPVGQTFVQPAGQTFVQPAGQTVVRPVGQTFVQPANVVNVVSGQQPSGVLVPSSASVPSSFGQFAVPVSTSVGPSSQLVQSVPSSFSSFPSFSTFSNVPSSVGSVGPAVQTFQSVPSSVFGQGSRFLFDNQQPGQFVQFGAPSTVSGLPGFTQNIVHLSAPRPQPVATVQTVPSFASTGSDLGSASGFTSIPSVSGKVFKQVTTGPVVGQTLPGFSAFSGFPSSSALPVPSFPTGSLSSQGSSNGKVFTDNKLSGFAGQQPQQPTVISQEKQFADTVQTTEWK